MDGTVDLAQFLTAYAVDSHLSAPRTEPSTSLQGQSSAGDSLDALLDQIGGMSFGNGLYRLHSRAEVAAWNATIATAWVETAGKLRVFGYDWLGRQFALYRGQVILQFSAGDLEFVEMPADPIDFHNEILVNYRHEALADEFFDAWLQSGGAPPSYSWCIGYKRPLFLGGVDWIENVEPIDLDVYWTVTAPVIAKARQVGAGGVIGQIEVGE